MNDELSKINDKYNNWDIVESSARREGVEAQVPAKRIEAYLGRVAGILEREGGAEKLSERIEDKLLTKLEDIPESYWQGQAQLLRDRGEDENTAKSKQFREQNFGAIRSTQENSLRSWTSYLSNKDCPYPTWFRVYAMDGASNMGKYEVEKKTFARRSKGTVAPLPKLNPAVLGKVYGVMEKKYSQGEKLDDDETDKLASGGNFNRLYSKFLLEQKTVLAVPKKAEDVHGEWIEYGLDRVEQLSAAADGTPWCIADETVARSYLQIGEYDKVTDESDEENGRFYLFHLTDESGIPSEQGCASVRMAFGEVAEISGLLDGSAQRLNDSLLSTVTEKVESLPGGESYLAALADSQRLVKIDQKLNAHELLTIEDVRFVLEVDRAIIPLSNSDECRDPRIEEFVENIRNACGDNGQPDEVILKTYEDALNKKVAWEELLRKKEAGEMMTTREILGLYRKDSLALVNSEAFNGTFTDLFGNLTVDAGSYIEQIENDPEVDTAKGLKMIVRGSKLSFLVENINKFMEYGAVNVDRLAERLGKGDKKNGLKKLVERGADANVLFRLVENSEVKKDIGFSLFMTAAGVDALTAFSNVDPDEIGNNTERLLDSILDINELARIVPPSVLIEYAYDFADKGVDGNIIRERLTPEEYEKNRVVFDMM